MFSYNYTNCYVRIKENAIDIRQFVQITTIAIFLVKISFHPKTNISKHLFPSLWCLSLFRHLQCFVSLLYSQSTHRQYKRKKFCVCVHGSVADWKIKWSWVNWTEHFTKVVKSLTNERNATRDWMDSVEQRRCHKTLQWPLVD